MMITVVSDKSVRYEALSAGVNAFLTRPIDQIECTTNCKNLLKIQEQQTIIKDRADWLARQVGVTVSQVELNEKDALVLLGKLSVYRVNRGGDSLEITGILAKIIATNIGLPEEVCNDIEYAAQLYNIGNISISDNILLKEGKLDSQELKLIRNHTIIGNELLNKSNSRYIQMAQILALNHHEHFDGNGYPNSISGKDIPVIARLVAVVDVFMALISNKPYRKAWSKESALNYIKELSGSQFDPKCVDSFIDCWPEIKAAIK